MRSSILSNRINLLRRACSLGVLATVVAGCSSGFQRFDDNFYQAAAPQPNQQQAAYNPYPGSNSSLDTITTASVSRSGVKRLAPLGSVAPQTYPQQLTHTPEPTYVTPQASYSPPQAYKPVVTQPQAQPLSRYQPTYTAPQPASQPITRQVNRVKSVALPKVAAPAQPSKLPVYTPPKPQAPSVASARDVISSQKTDRITTASIGAGTTVLQKQTSRVTQNVQRQAQQKIAAVPSVVNTAPKDLPAVAAPVVAKAADGWTSAGGTSVVARQGETLFNLSKRYGVPVYAILKANNMTSANQLQVGQQVLIPNYVFSPSAPVSAPDSNPKTLASRASTGYQGQAPVNHKILPTKRPYYVASAKAPVTRAPAVATAPKVLTPKTDKIITNSVKPNRPSQIAEVDSKTKAPKSTGISSFRWPVKGRVVSGFGQKGGIGSNEGIDISVPEGTAVRAAENGVVIYAGNEISTYGNLVLLQHADGWVSAYAHNKDFAVKKGDRVSRGQTISRSGKSGATDRPKLHFELRKNSKPVDPKKYLAG